MLLWHLAILQACVVTFNALSLIEMANKKCQSQQWDPANEATSYRTNKQMKSLYIYI